MTTSAYLAGRFKWARPQAVLFADDPGVLDNGTYIPQGTEREDFLILSDHNRSTLDFGFERIEDRRRMLNGTMRSYFVADKLKMSTSWDMLPSRSFSGDPTFNSSGIQTGQVTQYTVDGGAGGVELVDWYRDHPGSFYMFLSYDKYSNFESDRYNKLTKYADVVCVMFESFSYSVQKRGATNHDLWNISLSVVEV